MAATHHACSSSSSSSTISSSTTNYEVFLSFHGRDVRRNFADHLYTSLVGAEIRTFRDTEELDKGERIEKLLTAIQKSSIAIPIFSENYPSSKWCLKELTQISECRRTLNQIAMPIFYKVEPSDVRNQTGIYEKAFEQHQINMAPDAQKWREAMKEVGGLVGWHVNVETYEGEVVQEVVNTICDKLNKRLFSDNNNLVGAESHLETMLMHLDIESEDKKIIGIRGLGGIGKTTIAKLVYNKVSYHFEGCSFILDVRKVAEQHNGLVLLQKQLLQETSKYKVPDFTNKDAGIKEIQRIVCSKKVLIVLDDVDHEDQVKYLIGDRKWFSVGSKIIITTRDKRILDLCESDGIYEPPPMDSNESLQLFSHHAFKRDHPPDEFLVMSQAIVETTQGLPLALQVVGSSLSLEEDHLMWQEMLEKLQEVPHDDVMERLKISYDGLTREEKQMFLDIACFFIGMYENVVCYIWKGCGFLAKNGLKALHRKSLVTISEKGILGMHDLLRDMGRSIVYQENDNEPRKRTRIWSEEDVLRVLKEKEGTSRVMGLSVDFRSISEKESLRSEGFAGMTHLRLLRIDYAEFSWNFGHSFSELRWLSWKGCPNPCIQTDLRPCKLVVLDLSHSNITADWMGWNSIKMAKNLKVVDLSYCDQLSRTPDLSTNQNLEVLRFSWCAKLNEIDASICLLTNLVILDMEWCHKLRSLPAQISKLTNLQQLNLRNVPENLGRMVSLSDLKLHCGEYKESAVVDLSVEISQLTALQSLALYLLSGPSLKSISCLPHTSLTSLILYQCNSIQNISGLPSSLTRLSIYNCKSVVKVSSTSRGLINLKTFELYNCSRLEEIEGFDEKLDSLEDFTIQTCKSLRKLPNLRGSKYLRTLSIESNDLISNFEGGLEGMDSLEQLEIEHCNSLRKIPDLQESKRLRILKIRGCPQILEIGGCLDTCESLQELTIHDCCHSMERLPHHLSNLHKLMRLEIENLGKLTEIPGLDRLGSLRTLRIARCDAIPRLPDGLPNNLTHLFITECKNLTELHGINGLENLEELKISFCESLELLDFSNFNKLKHLQIEGNKNLDEVEELNISGSKFLEYFKISRFGYLQRLSDLSIFKKLSYLSIDSCNNLNEILGVGELESLKNLHISGCESLRRLPDLSNLKSLGRLHIEGCKNPTEIRGVDRLHNLWYLHIPGCDSLEVLPDLSNLTRLAYLAIEGCKNLNEIQSVDTLESLESLRIIGCESLEVLPNLSNLKKLSYLAIEGCKNLKEIQSVDTLESLSNLWIIGCESLETLSDLSNLKNLERLKVNDCKKLTEIRFGSNPLESLKRLDVKGCISLEKLPD